MKNQGRLFKLFLRTTGSVALLAVVAVAMPYSWMNAIHESLGMGPLPTEPIVGYLARSTSAFYALFGGLMWVVSFDLARYRAVLCYLGAATLLFGATLLAVDFVEGMPWWWRSFEGPINMAFGVLILAASLRRPHSGVCSNSDAQFSSGGSSGSSDSSSCSSNVQR